MNIGMRKRHLPPLVVASRTARGAIQISAATTATLPQWVRREIAVPSDEGGRNEQMIRIAPTLIGYGYDSVALHNLFDEMYSGEITSKEISSVLRSAARYAKRPLTTRDFDAKREAQLCQLT